MDQNETWRRVCRVIERLTAIPADEIGPGRALGYQPVPNIYAANAKPLELDSLDRIHLALKLEDEFGITITDDEVDAAELGYVGGLVAFVQGKLDAKPKTYGELLERSPAMQRTAIGVMMQLADEAVAHTDQVVRSIFLDAYRIGANGGYDPREAEAAWFTYRASHPRLA